MKADPFHPGELEAQRLAGQIAAGHGIRDHLTEQHRFFFAALPFVLVATLEPDGAPHARLLNGAPGFIRSPDPTTLELDGVTTLQAGEQVGLLGIDLATRRRNRANGVVRSNRQGVLQVTVIDSFGNCPKYITPRALQQAAGMAQAPQEFVGLDAAARAIVATSDTFFVATSGGAHGVDISHRGGPPGFARIDGDTLVIPDFSGNRYFNTLGNLLIEPCASLLFIDFAAGDVLTLRGEVSIAWSQREWRFHCAGGIHIKDAAPRLGCHSII